MVGNRRVARIIQAENVSPKIALENRPGYPVGMSFGNPHALIDAENRERDRRVAMLIRRQPEVIEHARRNLEKWAAHWGELTPAWLEWEQLLRMLTPAQVADFLESTSPKANRLRQSSPFTGVIERGANRSAAKPHAA